MKEQFKILPYLMILVVGMLSCRGSKDNPIADSVPVQRVIPVSMFPSTETESLMHAYQNDSSVICPFIAKMLATYELLEGGYQLLNSLCSGDVYVSGGQILEVDDDISDVDWSLTEYPRAIYDYNGRLKYYEFGLIENNNVIGIITTYARKEAACVIAYMFPYILPYTHTNYDYYVGRYPHRTFDDGIGFRWVEEGEPTSDYFSIDTYEYWSQLEAQVDDDEKQELQDLQSNSTLDNNTSAEIESFWEVVDYEVSRLANNYNLTDPCASPPSKPIINNFIEHLKDYLGTEEYCSDYTANPYCQTQLQQTHWSTGCAPAALAWIYRGLRNEYPFPGGEYLPLCGDPNSTYFINSLTYISGEYNSYGTYYYYLYDLDTLCWTNYNYVNSQYVLRSDEVDNGLTAVFFKNCLSVKYAGTWQFFMLPCKLDASLKSATNKEFGVYGDCSALTAADWIHVHNLPVLLLAQELDHYLAAYGYGGTSDTPGGNISRWNLYFLVTDNGYTIDDHAYMPYWRKYRTLEYYHRVYFNL